MTLGPSCEDRYPKTQQQINTAALQLACTGSGQDKGVVLFLLHKLMHLIQ